MIVHGNKIAQLAVHGRKVPSLWGQKIVSPKIFQERETLPIQLVSDVGIFLSICGTSWRGLSSTD